MIPYLLAWFPMLLLAITNGLFREGLLKKWLNDQTAHQVSTGTLILLLGGYIYYILQRFPPTSAVQAIVIGALWMTLTLVFEFGFGWYRGLSWQAMLADYNLLHGRLWLLVPLWIAIAPCVFFLLSQKQ